MPTADKRLLGLLLTAMMQDSIRYPQVARHLGNTFTAGLRQTDRFLFELLRECTLLF